MSISLLFWIIMVIGLVFGLYQNRGNALGWARNELVLWVLLALLGWAVFGAAVYR